MQKTFILILAVFLSLVPAAAYCDTAGSLNVYDITNDGVVTLNGKLPSAQSGAMVTLNVFYPDKTWQDLESGADNSGVIVMNDQLQSGDGGAYTFTFQIEGKSGYYNAYAGSDGLDTPQTVRILYSNKEERAAALTLLNAATTEDEVNGIIYGNSTTEAHWQALGFYTELCDSVNMQSVVGYIYNRIAENIKFDINDGAGAADIFRQLVVMQALNEKKISNIDDYSIIMKFSHGEMKDWYANPIVTTAMKQKITERLSSKGFSDLNTFNDAFKEALILEVIAKPDGFGNVKDILNQFASFIGIDTANTPDKAYQALAGKTYETKTELKNDFNANKNAGTDNGITTTAGKTSSKGGGVSLPSGGVNIGNTILPKTKLTPVSSDKFSDLQNVPWAKEAINTLAEKGIISGKSEKSFVPGDTITREEFTKLIVAAFQLKETDKKADFEDVKQDDWFYPYVSIAYGNGIVGGIGNQLFGSGHPITRQDLSVIIYKAMACKNIEMTSSVEKKTFSDQADIASYAADAVEKLQIIGVIKGTNDGRFNPNGLATRAEAAKVLYPLLGYIR